MKTFKQITLQGILLVLSILFLASCTTTPKLDGLVKSHAVQGITCGT
ncbi:MAG: hypothetical protein Q8K51_13980 [Nitrospirota bacterium]|nr:hypothetical protein [Nitrospirota bacterium]